MKRKEEAVALSEKRAGVIVVGLLLFIAVVIIIGSVESVVGETYFNKISPNTPSTWINDIDWVINAIEGTDSVFNKEYILTTLTSQYHKPSPQDAAKILSAILDTKPSSLFINDPTIKNILTTLWKSTEASIAKDIFVNLDSANQNKLFTNLDADNRIKLWDQMSWKNSFDLWKSLDSAGQTKFWNELKEGIYPEPPSRDGRLPRNLDFLQGALTGYKIEVPREKIEVPNDFPIKDLVSLVMKDVFNTGGTSGYDNLKKLLDRIDSLSLIKGEHADVNKFYRDFWNKIGNLENTKLLEKFFENKDIKYLSNFFNALNSGTATDKTEANKIALEYMRFVSATKGRHAKGKLASSDGKISDADKIEIKDVKGLESVDKIEDGKFVLKNGKKVDPVEVPVTADLMTFSAQGVSYQIRDEKGFYTLNDFSTTGFIDHYNRFYSVDANGARTLLGIADTPKMFGSTITFEDVKDSKGAVSGQKVSLENPTRVDGKDWKVYWIGSDNKAYTVADGKKTGSVVFKNGKPSETDLGMIMMSKDYFKAASDYAAVADEQRIKTLAAASTPTTPTPPVPITSAPITRALTPTTAAPSTAAQDNSQLQGFEDTLKLGTGVLYATGSKMNPEKFTVTEETKSSSDGKSVRSVSAKVEEQSDVSLVQYEGVHVASVDVVKGQDVYYFGAANRGYPDFKINGEKISSPFTGVEGEGVTSSAENPRLIQGSYDDGRTYSIINPKAQIAAGDANEQQGRQPDAVPDKPDADPSLSTTITASKPDIKSGGSISPPAPAGPQPQGSLKVTPVPSLTNPLDAIKNPPCTGSDCCGDKKCTMEDLSKTNPQLVQDIKSLQSSGAALSATIDPSKPIVLYISAKNDKGADTDWCGPCNTNHDGQVIERFASQGAANVFKVRSDGDLYPRYATINRDGEKSGIPVAVIIRNGVIIDRVIGETTPEYLRSKLN